MRSPSRSPISSTTASTCSSIWRTSFPIGSCSDLSVDDCTRVQRLFMFATGVRSCTPSRERDEPRWHLACEPHTVGAQIELEALGRHLARSYDQHDRLAATATHGRCRLEVWREMDELACAR